MAIYKCVKCLEADKREHRIDGEPCLLDVGKIPTPTPPDACPFKVIGGPEWELTE